MTSLFMFIFGRVLNLLYVHVYTYIYFWLCKLGLCETDVFGSDLELSDSEAKNYAEAIAVITRAYDKLFNTSFPYSSGIHQAPTDGEDNKHWHFHMSFYPPLLRSATVKKFMVGYEMFGSPQRDITAEIAAKRLKDLI